MNGKSRDSASSASRYIAGSDSDSLDALSSLYLLDSRPTLASVEMLPSPADAYQPIKDSVMSWMSDYSFAVIGVIAVVLFFKAFRFGS